MICKIKKGVLCIVIILFLIFVGSLFGLIGWFNMTTTFVNVEDIDGDNVEISYESKHNLPCSAILPSIINCETDGRCNNINTGGKYNLNYICGLTSYAINQQSITYEFNTYNYYEWLRTYSAFFSALYLLAILWQIHKFCRHHGHCLDENDV